MQVQHQEILVLGFLGNLVSGVKQGLDNFIANIMNHLQGGLIGWLTGAMGSMGILLPDDIFSLKGIFSLVTQILGMTWDYIRRKAVKLVENALARSLPVVIGFLASLLGISGLAKKVQGIVKKIRSRIDKAIDKVLKKAKSLFKGKKGKGNKDKKNKENELDERTQEEKEADLGKAMKEAKSYLDKFSDKEVKKKTIKSKFNKIKKSID